MQLNGVVQDVQAFHEATAQLEAIDPRDRDQTWYDQIDGLWAAHNRRRDADEQYAAAASAWYAEEAQEAWKQAWEHNDER